MGPTPLPSPHTPWSKPPLLPTGEAGPTAASSGTGVRVREGRAQKHPLTGEHSMEQGFPKADC